MEVPKGKETPNQMAKRLGNSILIYDLFLAKRLNLPKTVYLLPAKADDKINRASDAPEEWAPDAAAELLRLPGEAWLSAPDVGQPAAEHLRSPTWDVVLLCWEELPNPQQEARLVSQAPNERRPSRGSAVGVLPPSVQTFPN